MKKILLMSAFVLCLIGCKSNDPDDYGYLLTRNNTNISLFLHIYGLYPDSIYIHDFYLPPESEKITKMHKGQYTCIATFEDKEPIESLPYVYSRDTFEMNFGIKQKK